MCPKSWQKSDQKLFKCVQTKNYALGFLVSSTRNTMLPVNRPTIRTIIMIPSCLSMRGWLCLTVGSGIFVGGFQASYFTLSGIPVSFSHIIDCVHLSCARWSQSASCSYNIFYLCFLPAVGFRWAQPNLNILSTQHLCLHGNYSDSLLSLHEQRAQLQFHLWSCSLFRFNHDVLEVNFKVGLLFLHF